MFENLASHRPAIVSLVFAAAIGSGAAVAVVVTNASHNAPATQAAGTTPNGGESGAVSTGSGNANGKTKDKDEKGKTFSIQGAVTGLAPGATRPLVLTIDNPNSQAIRVQTLSVQVAAANASCPGSAVSVGAFTPLTVEGRSTATTTVDVHLADSVANACSAATWTLSYSGTAVKA